MTNINYNTDKLIVISYPGNAGGKFIGLCLSLSSKILHQDKTLAKIKMKNLMSEKKSFEICMKILQKSKDTNYHFELNNVKFCGFHLGYTKKQQELSANKFWGDLTNQQEFFFSLVHHPGGGFYSHYPEAYHIILKNYEWILKDRKTEINKVHYQRNLRKDKTYNFDQSTIKDRTSFAKEITNLFVFLKLNHPNFNHIENLRKCFLKTYKIGF
jgi:hypothetical protein